MDSQDQTAPARAQTAKPHVFRCVSPDLLRILGSAGSQFSPCGREAGLAQHWWRPLTAPKDDKDKGRLPTANAFWTSLDSFHGWDDWKFATYIPHGQSQANFFLLLSPFQIIFGTTPTDHLCSLPWRQWQRTQLDLWWRKGRRLRTCSISSSRYGLDI